MAYTTAEQVEQIIEVESNHSLDPFILVAHELVVELCSDAEYSDARLELIERWLAAHFYTNLSGRAFIEKAGSVAETKQSKVDLGFSTSHYGQTAMALDTAGGLAALNAATLNARVTRIASVTWLGTDEDVP